MGYIFIFLCILIVLIGLYISVKWRELRHYNQSPLKIETFDGLRSPFHPSVLFFPDGWCGWRYWMAETPFSPKCKPYVDRNECPSIHVSQDGINWTEPAGLINPIVDFGREGEENLDYFSDPHLVLTDSGLECWYRKTERDGDFNKRHQVSLRRITSKNGVDWASEEIISKLWLEGDNNGLGRMIVSPAILRSANEEYRMWYVDSEDAHGERQVKYSSSNDGKEWNEATVCTMSGKPINPWHIDVMQTNDGFHLMTVYDYNDLTLWRSEDGLSWNFLRTLLKPSNKVGSMYRSGLYRSCLIQNEDEYCLFFSAYDRQSSHIGLAKLKDLYEDIYIISFELNYTFFRFVQCLITDDLDRLTFVVKNKIKHIIHSVSKL